jgi:peptide/nickel transport system permease protein
MVRGHREQEQPQGSDWLGVGTRPILEAEPESAGWFRRLQQRMALLRLGRLEVLGIVLVVTVVIAAIGAPLLTRYAPSAFVAEALVRPCFSYPFGTDNLGRDIFTRVLFGARYSMFLSAMVLGFATVAGVGIGAAAAVIGGLVDEGLMRVADIFFAFPYLVAALAISAALTPSLTSMIIALAIVWWPSYARLVRAQILVIKSMPYVEASRAVGQTELGMIRRHYLPYCVGILLIRISTDVGYVIAIATGLSFIGLGAQVPTPEWGLMVAEARTHVFTAPWLAIFPGLAIFVTIVAFVLLGDFFQDMFDPTLRRRGGR